MDGWLTRRTVQLKPAPVASGTGRPMVGFIGSSNYATGVLIPAFAKTKVRLKSVASSGGVSGVHVAKSMASRRRPRMRPV